jgi:hypothetical protein
MPSAHVEESIDACGEPVWIRVPEQIVQVDPDDVQSELRTPGELAFDRRQVECVGLPHLQLVDRGTGDEVAADQPGLLLPPARGLLNAPHRVSALPYRAAP